MVKQKDNFLFLKRSKINGIRLFNILIKLDKQVEIELVFYLKIETLLRKFLGWKLFDFSCFGPFYISRNAVK
ncbi:hypothetical protein HMPREF9087_2754 [Enterococcus casseliflavus ATCC 12755]|uniref:Uncharacterized protein n=1 Tax=Enterococcus casseliflavus ATCC 12755 TaxID=888066 RepID=F0EMN5_ENTCA|nr:hypothetical protein HMPREF9087_2754 [Enterococcus casseliflavus ATCC 12755]